MKRFILIISIIIFLAAVVFAIMYFLRTPSSQPTATPFPLVSPGINSSAVPMLSSLPSPSADNKISIPQYDIQVNNFYQDATLVTPQGGALFSEIGDYTLHYEPQGNFFAIFINYSPLQEVRMQSEKAFLEKLGISKTQACALPVRMYVQATADESRSGMDYGLSFCPQGRAF